MLRVSDLRAGYDRLEVLHGLDLTAQRGEIVAIIGVNGAGKSTFLRAISGLLRTRGGTVQLDGDNITSMPAERVAARGLAHVPENRLVFPNLSVADNLRLGGWLRRREDSGASLDRPIELFPRLGERLAQAAGTLSGGEQQMLAIARGLMSKPKVLALDEPSLGLAPRVVAEIFTALARLRDEEQLAIVLVEQNARAAFKVADRVYLIDRGKVLLEGTPAELEETEVLQAAYLGGYQSEAGTVSGG